MKGLALAIHCRQPKRGLLFHSDRGVQYSNRAFRQCPADFGIKQSQSRAGKGTDNAVTERFFRSLKREKLYRKN
ncbi:DDE-type integrase/transposase/recombinase [Aggregatibacter actinomycetemcomitans]|nr:DDE-type integrase/transposase/recombinase [Aggregatibacter actinomycetemcomitans]